MRYTGVDEFLYNGSLKSENTFIKKKKSSLKNWTGSLYFLDDPGNY